MAWTSPMTAVTGNVHTAAQFNTGWRDNMLVSEAAVATTAGRFLVTDAARSIIERTPLVAFTAGGDSTNSATYTTLAVDTSVAANIGQYVLISFGGQVSTDTAGLGARISVDISGSTNQVAVDTNSFYAESGNANDAHQGTWTTIITSLNPGLMLFSLRYRTTAGGGTSSFNRRLLTVTSF
ncbi:MAG: hypothetical protein ABIS86_17070 [Streptosporangiaceae bacterium]